MDAVQHHRETVQPIREKTGGSTFKNPEGTSAWKEIDKAGCRGLMIGGAQMSPMHCNFMINTGNATGYDLEYLGETVRARVLETLRHPAAMGDQAHRQLQAGPRGPGVSGAVALGAERAWSVETRSIGYHRPESDLVSASTGSASVRWRSLRQIEAGAGSRAPFDVP